MQVPAPKRMHQHGTIITTSWGFRPLCCPHQMACTWGELLHGAALFCFRGFTQRRAPLRTSVAGIPRGLWMILGGFWMVSVTSWGVLVGVCYFLVDFGWFLSISGGFWVVAVYHWWLLHGCRYFMDNCSPTNFVPDTCHSRPHCLGVTHCALSNGEAI
jgi:hypothetical protein